MQQLQLLTNSVYQRLDRAESIWIAVVASCVCKIVQAICSGQDQDAPRWSMRVANCQAQNQAIKSSLRIQDLRTLDGDLHGTLAIGEFYVVGSIDGGTPKSSSHVVLNSP
jgi:hypothetical protein